MASLTLVAIGAYLFIKRTPTPAQTPAQPVAGQGTTPVNDDRLFLKPSGKDKVMLTLTDSHGQKIRQDVFSYLSLANVLGNGLFLVWVNSKPQLYDRNGPRRLSDDVLASTTFRTESGLDSTGRPFTFDDASVGAERCKALSQGQPFMFCQTSIVNLLTGIEHIFGRDALKDYYPQSHAHALSPDKKSMFFLAVRTDERQALLDQQQILEEQLKVATSRSEAERINNEFNKLALTLTLLKVDIQSGELIKAFPIKPEPEVGIMGLSPNGNVLIRHIDYSITLVDPIAGTQKTLAIPASSQFYSFSPDGTKVIMAAASKTGNQVGYLDLTTQQYYLIPNDANRTYDMNSFRWYSNSAFEFATSSNSPSPGNFRFDVASHALTPISTEFGLLLGMFVR